MGEAEKRILLSGPRTVAAWKLQNPGKLLDCSGDSFIGIGASFENHDMRGIDLSRANFEGLLLNSVNFEEVDLRGANFTSARLVSANFKCAKLDDAIFFDANLSQCELAEASLVATNFRNANLADIVCPYRDFSKATVLGTSFHNSRLNNSNFEGCDLKGANFQQSDLRESNLSRSQLQEANLTSADLTGAILEGAVFDSSRMQAVKLNGSLLRRASFRKADLRQSDLQGAIIDGSDFFEATVDNANFDEVKGAAQARNLSTVRFEQKAYDVRYFDSVVISSLDEHLSWERIRGLGRLPLFVASYSALVVIPFLFYLLDVFNRKVDQLRAMAQSAVDRSEHGSSLVAQTMMNHLHREPIPSLSAFLLVSTIVLSAGATIFALACPPRIKEFSRDQWRDQLGHSLIHYLPLSWRRRSWRVMCVALYAVGGVGVAWVLTAKIWAALMFITRNS